MALADALSVAAARSVPPSSLKLSLSAAELRVRMWRIGHADSDAREALETYADASKTALLRGATQDACRASLGQAYLLAEQSRDPGLLYRALYSAQKLLAGSPCESELAQGLALAAAYRPAASTLAELDRLSERARSNPAHGPDPQGRNAPSGSRVVSSDEKGVVIAPKALENQAAKIVAIEPYGSRDRARVVVTLNAPAAYRVGELDGPRIFVDFEKTEPSSVREIRGVGLVERLRQAPRPGGAGTRIVLHLARTAYRRIFYLPEPFRVVIDLATSPPANTEPKPGAARVVSRIALDPGHGGSDPGAIGPSGLREKDVTLAIGHLAAPVLSRELGIPTLLTRDDDRNVPLDERAARANAFHADLFISIHCNASEASAARGVMSFVLDTTKDDLAAKVAARENATSVAATQQISAIATSLKIADLGTRSTHFAELLERSAMGALLAGFPDAVDQGVKTAGFYVLVGAEMPSVLFETAFISNPVEEKRLSTAEYRRKLADSIVNAVRAYREGR